MIQTLAVSLRDTLVGHLTNLPDDSTVFAFTPEYVADHDRPVLSQSFVSHDGSVLESTGRTHRLAPPFFANLLPEGGLRTLIAKHLDVSPERDFPLLTYLGADLIGAVVLSPSQPVAPPPSDALTFSLPGVQLKLSALLTETDALTIPVHGLGGDWIVKLSSGNYPGLTENEYSMLRFAQAAGIDVPEIRLVPIDEITGIPADFNVRGMAFAIRRFDRASDTLRVHTEDFNQAFGQFPHEKYKNYTYADMVRLTNERGAFTDARELIRRITFNAMIGNGDMHLKNSSLIYRDARTPQVSPAYDYVSTLPYPNVDHNLALSFGESKDRAIYDDDRLRRFARRASLPMSIVRRDVRAMIERTWDARGVLHELPLFDEHRAMILADLERFTDGIAHR